MQNFQKRVNLPMISQSKATSKIGSDLLIGALGMLGGSLVVLAGFWLWQNYQADPAHSLLAMFSSNLVEYLPSSWRVLVSQEARRMGLPLIGQTPAFWYMARSGGIVGYLLLWLSVLWGLVLSTRVTAQWLPAPLVYGLHEFLSLGAVVFSTLHAAILLGDRYINFDILHLVIPFTAPYEPIWTGLGTVAFYLIAVLTGSFYIRRQIGHKMWRVLHYLTFAAFALVLAHGLLAGTDSRLGEVQLMYLFTGISVLFLTYYRLLTIKI
jgi:predicted ferric reductase